MAGKTVLIVDDSRTTQMLVETTLKRLPGVRLLRANDGRQALERLSQEQVDLLITDINMPEMDGLQLVEAVRATTAALPILIITAKEEQRARERGLALGANAYALKPLDGRALLDSVTSLLK